MEQNRRNYYRTLRVQPDASLDVIKSSYRTLLQKLRIHPDLGGDEWNTRIINQAYNTLRNPEKRASYDKQLLEEYSLEQLSSGYINRKYNNKEKKTVAGTNPDGLNNRNYYRILHIQNDSPSAIIQASFNILIKKQNTDEQAQCIREAFDILNNKDKKEMYDNLLEQHGHQEAVVLLRNHFSGDSGSGKDGRVKARKKAIQNYQLMKEKASVETSLSKQSDYKPLITQYCAFCKTPHNQSPCPEQAPLCMECSSPLFPPSDNFLNQSRRDLTRFKVNDPINIYYDWPGMQINTVMSDISPTGLCIHSSEQVDKGLIVKIDSNEFKAVGEITYSHKQNAIYNTGVRFITVQFNRQKGQFFSLHT